MAIDLEKDTIYHLIYNNTALTKTYYRKGGVPEWMIYLDSQSPYDQQRIVQIANDFMSEQYERYGIGVEDYLSQGIIFNEQQSDEIRELARKTFLS